MLRDIVQHSKAAIFGLLPTVFFALLLEGGAFLVLWTRQVEVPHESPEYRELRVGLHPWGEVTRIPITPDGSHRHEPDPATAKNGCAHLVVAGDSQAFGVGVNGDETFTQLLRERLIQGGRCVRVYNIAYPADGPAEQTQRIVATFETLKPDVIVIAQYANDLTQIVDADALPFVPMGFDVEQLHIVKVLRWHRWAWMYRNRETTLTLFPGLWPLPDTLPKEIQAEARVRYERWLLRLRGYLTGRGVEVGMVALSGVENFRSGLHWEADTVEAVAIASRVPVLKMYPHFDGHRDRYPFVMYEGHYNEDGHRVIARAMYEWLLGDENGRPRFARLADAVRIPQTAPAPSNR